MGTVYRARDRRSGRRVAIKVLDRATDDGVARFVREAQALAALEHPAIVAYIDHGAAAGGVHWLATEWLEGETLATRLERGRLTAEDTVALARRIADALAAVHARGIVHRDLKPSNLFLVGGEIAAIKLLDFGVAFLDESQSTTRTGALVGTPEYMAPEQARGDKGVDARADVFAFGCVLYECLAGVAAFGGEHLAAVLGKILFATPTPLAVVASATPRGLAALIGRMLAKAREDRPADGAALLAALDELGEPSRDHGPEDTSGFGWHERQVVSVVLAGPGLEGGASSDPWGATAVDARPALARIRATMGTLDVAIEQLADGGLLATLSGRRTASDLAAAAARCALRVRAALPAVPIAVATGRGLLAGPTAVGEVIDRVVAMLERTAPARISLDDTTAGLLAPQFDVHAGDGGLLLDGERAPGDSTRRLLGRPTSCVGRDRELAALTATWAECVGERVARAVVVTAGAGVGKSRLRYELGLRLAGGEAPPQLWTVWADPTRAGSPLGLIAAVIRCAVGLRDGDDQATTRSRLQARIGLHLGADDRERVASYLGELIGLPLADHDDAAVRAGRGDLRLLVDHRRRAWIDWLRAECAAAPVLLVLEDLHWGDPSSVAMVDAALGALADLPLMVLALARPELHGVFPELWAARAPLGIELGDLPRRAAERLVREVLPRVDDEVVARLIERAAGNAFYLEELIRAVAEGRGDRLPETITAMAGARLDALAPELRRTLRAASVLGDVCWRGAVRAVLGEPGHALDVELAALVDAELLATREPARFPGEVEYVFRHAIVRDAAYASLTVEDRRLGHHRAGTWLAARGDPDARAIALHLEAGGDAEAATWWLAAAEHALAADDLDAACGHAQAGIATASGELAARLALVLGDAEAWRGNFAIAAEHAERALRAFGPGELRWFRALGVALRADGRLGRYHRVATLAGDAAALEPMGPALSAQATCLCTAASSLFHAGDYPAAQRVIARVDEIVAARGEQLDGGALAEAHRLRAAQARQAGDPWGDARGYREALAAYLRAGDERGACNARVSLGFALTELGELERAEDELRWALIDAERLGIGAIASRARHNLGLVLCERGDLAEAEVIEAQAAAEAAAQDNPRLEGGSRIYLAMIALRRGDHAGAEREATRAGELFAAMPPARAGAEAARALALLGLGRADDALTAARAAAATLAALGHIEEYEAMVRVALIEALLATEDRGAAVDEAGAGLRRLEARAGFIPDEDGRRRFLANDRYNARLVELAAMLG